MKVANLTRAHGLWGVLALGALACQSTPAPTATKKPLVATGAWTTTWAGKPVSVDYTGKTATAVVVHRLNTTGPACITQLDIRVAEADGSCELDLQWRPGQGALALQSAAFHAVGTTTQDGVVIDTKVCAGWPETSTKTLTYTGSSPDATLSMKPLAQPEAGQAAPTLSVNWAMTGSVTLKAGGKQFPLDLSKLSFAGDVSSQGRTDVSCGQVGPVSGVDQCPASVKYGPGIGQYLQRGTILHACADDSEVDLGELCGHAAIAVIDWREWTAVQNGQNKSAFEDFAQIYNQFKDADVGAAFIVVEGTKKTADGGPLKKENAPTAAECQHFVRRMNLPAKVLVLYD